MFDISTPITEPLGFVIRLGLACIFGYLIGLERQWTKHQAGTVTCLIVCVGSYAFSAFGYLVEQSDKLDITRIPAQVVCGIGFLGAGLIIQKESNIKGLTTAATIWATAAVGILCCLNNIVYPGAVTLAIVVLHLLLHPLSVEIDKRRRYQKKNYNNAEKLYKISVLCPEEVAGEIKMNIINTIRIEPDALLKTVETVDADDDNKKIRAFISTKRASNALIENLLTKVSQDKNIITASWRIMDEKE